MKKLLIGMIGTILLLTGALKMSQQLTKNTQYNDLTVRYYLGIDVYKRQATGASPDPYEKLIYDVLNNNSTNFSHWDEVSASWKLIDRIEKLWAENGAPSVVSTNI